MFHVVSCKKLYKPFVPFSFVGIITVAQVGHLKTCCSWVAPYSFDARHPHTRGAKTQRHMHTGLIAANISRAQRHPLVNPRRFPQVPRVAKVSTSARGVYSGAQPLPLATLDPH